DVYKRQWLHRDHNGPQIVIRYEELVNDPDKVVANVLKTFDLKPVTTGGKMPDFATLHRKWPRFFRKGKPGSWREEMSDALHDLFWQHHAAAMNALGYKR
ncbi:MAG: sulfotransferase domain-containing protein, partial [Chthoniobacterales bacterium]|nr:sulfotransferase domain-containing protein [Chthoniobacterales bacterium]